MTQTPNISVIVPVYNVERYVKLCIDSILAQSFQDFEIIIIDDASPDNSYKICQELYGTNEKVRIIRHEKNQGLGPARNTGIENARGKYVYFVDSDDAIVPQALEILYNVAEKTGADVVHTSGYFETEQDDDTPLSVNRFKMAREPHHTEGFLNPDILHRWENCWQHWSDADGIRPMAWLNFCKREIFKKYQLHFESINSPNELFSFEIFTYVEKFFTINKAVYVYRQRENSIMRTDGSQRLEKVLRAMFVTIAKMKFVMNRFAELRDKTDIQEHFINRLLDAHYINHIKPFYANGLNAESINVINNILGGMFGETATFVKYLFNRTNSLQVQFDNLNTQAGQLYLVYQHSLNRQNNIEPRSLETFVNNIERDEMRNGFLVTSHRKKLWNVQIGLINEFARICKKYNLKWFACGGTLLGAARHKGFIPWDDDVDVAMMRPDYNKFVKIAAKEIKYPYFLDNWYNYRRENDDTAFLPSESQLPLIRESSFAFGGFPDFPVLKIRDSRTTLIEFPDRKDTHQGIWIDIFPFDVLPPFMDDTNKVNFEIARELLIATKRPRLVKKAIESKQQFLLSYEELEKFINLPYRQRGSYFDDFEEKIFFRSEKVGDMRVYAFNSGWAYDTKDFDEIVYLPFEEIEIPAPYNFDNVLKSQYGNWHEMKITHTHAKDWSADIPYTEYYKTSAFMR